MVFYFGVSIQLMFPYEQLEVYNKAYYLNQKIFRLIKVNNSIADYVNSQLGRAGLSIMLNIAEGSAKLSTKDRRNYFITARGSVFECCSIICFLFDEKEIPADFKTELYNLSEEISKMLYVMIKNLSNQTEEKGKEKEKG